jgi:hypothetical protein
MQRLVALIRKVEEKYFDYVDGGDATYSAYRECDVFTRRHVG